MKKRYLISETGDIIGYEEKGIVYTRLLRYSGDMFFPSDYNFEKYIKYGFREITEEEFLLELL